MQTFINQATCNLEFFRKKAENSFNGFYHWVRVLVRGGVPATDSEGDKVLAVKVQKLKINEPIKWGFYLGSYQPEVSRRVKHSGQIFLCHDESVGVK